MGVGVCRYGEVVGPELVYLDGLIFYAPGGAVALRCIARLSNGQRCRGKVCGGLRGRWVPVRTPLGEIAVYRPTADAATVSRWLSQHCKMHSRAGIVDAVPREWDRFSPRDRHAWLVASPTTAAELSRKAVLGSL
ncbi:hypothetical protein Ato02nite_021990 [Paractinoplanes toevensis]|uniref:Uncharacterized protein n=1 Tax=Paractinoplanes toevensis TaxID=571911 RepID=A0A919T972_9ACTN|nr:hypothetical protein Ato02nite_021990 [Actinoplanes toevensis]